MANRMAHIPFSPAKCPVFYGWPVVGVGALGILMSVPGQTMGVSVFTDSLLTVLGLTRDQLSTAYMCGTLGSACLLPYAGRLYDRLGSRVMAVVASVCLSLALVGLSRSDALAGYVAARLGLAVPVAAYGVIVVGFLALRFWGQGVLTLTSRNMVSKWFDRRRGLAVGLSGILTASGFSIAPLALDGLIRQFGWRGAWVMLAIVVGGFFAFIASVLYRDNPEECGLQPDGVSKEQREAEARETTSEPCWTLAQARRTAAFWTFSLSLALSALYTTGLTFHVVSIFQAVEMTRSQAVMIFLPMSGVAVVTRFLTGWLSDRMALNLLLVAMLTFMATSMIGLSNLKPGWPVAMVIIGNGVTTGMFGLLSTVTWANFFGRRHLGAISGLNMSMIVLFSAVGPVLFSRSLSWTGAYRSAGVACLLATAVLFVAALRVRRPRQALA